MLPGCSHFTPHTQHWAVWRLGLEAALEHPVCVAGVRGRGGVHIVLQVDWVPVSLTFQAHLPLVTTEALQCPSPGRAHQGTWLLQGPSGPASWLGCRDTESREAALVTPICPERSPKGQLNPRPQHLGAPSPSYWRGRGGAGLKNSLFPEIRAGLSLST